MPVINSVFKPERPIREVFLHEDDYCLVELLPAANWWWCLEEMRRIDGEALKHEAGGGGWTNIEVSGLRPMPFGDLEIDVNDLVQHLHRSLPVFDRVVEGYSDRREAVVDTLAFGHSAEGALFTEFDLSGTVTALWLSPHPRTFHESARVISVLGDLSRRLDLILADWQWNHLIRPSEPNALNQWLASRRANFWGASQLNLWDEPR